MVLLIIGAFFFIVLIEAPGLFIRKNGRELVAFFFFWSLAFIFSFLFTMGYKLPSPVKAIEFVIEYILRLFR